MNVGQRRGGEWDEGSEEEERKPLTDGSTADLTHYGRFQYQYLWVAGVAALLGATLLAACLLAVSEGTSELSRVLSMAARSGVAGGASMFVNVLAFMWLRTTINYQQASVGLGSFAAMRMLYAEGGVARFYRGLLPALAQGPLCRFGDTAANAGAAALIPQLWFSGANGHAHFKILAVTLAGTTLAAAWRLLVTPIDTLKTTLQVSGAVAAGQLHRKVRRYGPCVLWDGGYGGAAASAVGYFPWFLTYNTLDARLPAVSGRAFYVVRNAALGLCASIVSDLASNGVRVVKVVKQTSSTQISYAAALRSILLSEGTAGLRRGLGTKLVANGIQACVFSVMWRLLRDAMAPAHS